MKSRANKIKGVIRRGEKEACEEGQKDILIHTGATPVIDTIVDDMASYILNMEPYILNTTSTGWLPAGREIKRCECGRER